MELRIEEINECTQPMIRQIIQLMNELSTRCVCTEESLRAVVDDSCCHLFCAFDGEHVVGCATLCVFHSPTGTKGSVEDVVVASDYRGCHLGRQLMAQLLQTADNYAPIELHLTSRPSRQAANNLYTSLGFERKETNCYQMEILLGERAKGLKG